MQNETRLLIQVVPRLTPTRCGVSDHAITLANKLRSSFSIESVFVILNSNEQCNVPYRMIHCDPVRLLESCRMLGEKRQTALLVHVSGYGYSRDGAPQALANSLVTIRETDRFPVAAYFHELYATGAPWRSAFWYSRKQQREVARIAQVCSLLVTNSTYHASWLQREMSSGSRLQILPVFSNVGESRDVLEWEKRNPALIVFGQSDTRRRAYQQLSKMTSTIHRLRVQEIIDVGAEADVPLTIGALKVRRMGRMSPADLCGLIASTQFGFVRFPANELAKSSVMASLCTFGAVPVLAEPFQGEVDELSDGVHVITPKSVESASFAQCSRAAWKWYRQHNVSAHARVYEGWIPGSKVREAAAL